MTHAVLIAVIWIVRAWTRVYTCGIEPQAADLRRAELDSDLWEFAHDPHRVNDLLAATILLRRLATGAADDLLWRLELADAGEALLVRRAGTITAAAIVILLMLLIPVRLTGGRAEALQCGLLTPQPQDSAEYRLQVVTCAGAYFRGTR